MTYRTVEESGLFRKGEEGVFSGASVYFAPPPNMVNELMKDLFSWVKTVKGQYIRLLCQLFSLRICVYTSFCRRKWKNGQIMAYGTYNAGEMFEYIPLESQIERFQAEYYDAIANAM